MSKDHYEFLGVSKLATTEEIEKAYSKMAKQHHPDRGGDRKVFERAVVAYSTLSDPEKRQRYDEYGEEPQFNTFNDVMGILAQALDQVVEQLVEQGYDLDKVDLAKHMDVGMVQVLNQLSESKSSFQKKLKGFQKMLKRWKRGKKKKDKPSEIKQVIEHQIDRLKHQITYTDNTIKAAEEVIRIFREHEYDFDQSNYTQRPGKSGWVTSTVFDAWLSGADKFKFDPPRESK